MLFSHRLEELHTYYTDLDALRQLTPLQEVVRDAIGHIFKNAHIFDVSVRHSSSFLQEFFHYIENKDISEEACFSLFECIAVIFREKSLCRQQHAKNPVETSVLHYFETCGEWSRTDNTMITTWYWNTFKNERAIGLYA